MKNLKIALLGILFFSMTNLISAGENKSNTKSTSGTLKTSQRIATDKFLKDWSLTLHGGTTSPFTDIRSYDWVRQTKKPSELQWGAGISLTKMCGPVFGVQLDYTLGKLLGRTVTRGGFAEDRLYWKQLGFNQEVYFKAPLFHQATVNVYVNWSNMFFAINRWIKSNKTQKPWKERRVSIYSKLGVGLIRTESKIYNTKDDKLYSPSQYLKGYTNKFTEVVFPLAMGMKIKCNKSFDIGIEGNFVFTNTDKLDAYSAHSDAVLASNPNGSTLKKMNRDAYAYLNVGVTYKFGRIGAQKEHNEWVNPLEAYMSVIDSKIKDPFVVKDKDGDGILDELDQEPETPEGAKVDSHGKTLDSDGDGIPDHLDKEPFSTPMLPIVDGVNQYPKDSVIPQDIKQLINNEIKSGNTTAGWALSMIFFDLDKYNIKASEVPELYKVATVMQKYPDLKVYVKGYTDTRNTEAYNEKLSENRVNSAVDFLVKKFNISRDRFLPSHFGETDNIIPNATGEPEHHVNRRVEFTPANY